MSDNTKEFMRVDIDDFCQFATVKLNLSAGSLRHCKSRIRLFNQWLFENRVGINTESVESFVYSLKKRGLKNNSINTYIFSLRQLDSYATARKWPVSGFSKSLHSLTKNKPKIEILTPQELFNLLKTNLTYGRFRGMDCSRLNSTYRCLIQFIGLTGCRYAEAADLKLENVDVSGLWVTFENTKNHEYRRVHVAKALMENLIIEMAGKSHQDYVFTTMLDGRISAASFGEDLKKRARAAGISKRVHPHLLRHSFATHLLEENVDVSKVATILGHKDIQTTYNNYVHLADKTLKKAVVRHPLIKKTADPQDILSDMAELIRSYNLCGDGRFKCSLNVMDDGLNFNLKIRGSPKRDAPPLDRKI